MAAMCQYLGRSVDCRRVCGPPVSNREATVRHVPRPVSSSVVVCSTRTVSCNTMSVNAASVAALAEVADPMTRSRGKVVELSTATFDWFLQQAGDTPVVVDFFTDWCGPCKLIAPVVAESAQELPGVRFAKFNCGTNDKRFAVEKQIKALPTFHVYHKGQKVGQFVGAKPRDFRRWAQSVGVDFGAAN